MNSNQSCFTSEAKEKENLTDLLTKLIYLSRFRTYCSTIDIKGNMTGCQTFFVNVLDRNRFFTFPQFKNFACNYELEKEFPELGYY